MGYKSHTSIYTLFLTLFLAEFIGCEHIEYSHVLLYFMLNLIWIFAPKVQINHTELKGFVRTYHLTS
jgi:hypothetical protein